MENRDEKNREKKNPKIYKKLTDTKEIVFILPSSDHLSGIAYRYSFVLPIQ
jgi:hypothetical protein